MGEFLSGSFDGDVNCCFDFFQNVKADLAQLLHEPKGRNTSHLKAVRRRKFAQAVFGGRVKTGYVSRIALT